MAFHDVLFPTAISRGSQGGPERKTDVVEACAFGDVHPKLCCELGITQRKRGRFVGGGGSARIPRLIGVARMTDLMMTGRVLSADEGHQIGISNYLVEEGDGLAQALAVAGTVAENSPITNFAIINALPRIADASPEDGYLMESMMSAIAQGSDEAKRRMQAFLEGRAARVDAEGAGHAG